MQVPGPDVMGDQMLWSVYNDANPGLHTNRAGQSAPLGVEVQQATFAFNVPGALGNTIYMRFRIINKGGQGLESMNVSLWSDPDVGGPGDDLEGSDIGRSLGYAYNATNNDAVYGATPPAVGVDLLGPGRASAFSYYINGRDPQNAGETYNLMRGLNSDGTPVIDPTTGLPSLYYAPGDPVAGTGWLDSKRPIVACCSRGAPARLRRGSRWTSGPRSSLPGGPIAWVPWRCSSATTTTRTRCGASDSRPSRRSGARATWPRR